MLNTRLGYLALFSALFISGIAIYFSVAGLAAIFSAYATSIVVMGTAIELGKLIAVVWLHYNWKDPALVLKAGLSFFVVGVMFITSMGIFGYLSKSHVEQTAQSQESVAQVERIGTEIARFTAVIARSEQKIESYENNGSGVDASLNSQIDKEQARIDSAYDRVKPVIQVQLDIIASDETKTKLRTAPYQTELDAISQQLTDLQTALNNKQIKTAQGIVGTKPDGSYKVETEKAIKEFRTRNGARRGELLKKIDSIRGTPSIAAKSAQEEINRIRASVQSEINESNATIKNLRGRMGKSNANDIETLITTEHNKIKESNIELDTLTEEKYKLEAGYRKLVAEVGPIKYIAEFVYDQEADAKLLEKAVKWLIILIIFVFDPFAVFLLIAAQHSFDRGRKEREAHEEIGAKNEALGKINDIVHKAEDVLHEAVTVEHNLEDMLDDYPHEPAMPENIDISEHDLTVVDEEVSPDKQAVIPPQKTKAIILTKVADNYINYNGKTYQADALIRSFPNLNLNFNNEVRSGDTFPPNSTAGMMFMRSDQTPTQLYIFNGDGWDTVDKKLLNFTAYSHEYIKALIKRVGNGEYNPELLNEAEKKHIEELLSRE